MNPNKLIKKLEVVSLRKAFPNEAQDLTPWLAENLDALGERLGIELSLEQKEKSVGDFQVDLFCQDGEGQKAIVENQLEETDHDHLGKLMTYLVNLGAKTAIWITSSPRPEHQKVIEWLNETMPDDMSFYLVKVEAIKTGDPAYSPLFSVLARPDRQSRKVGQEKKEWAQRHYERMDFWRALLSKPAIKDTAFANKEPTRYNFINGTNFLRTARFGFSVNVHDAYVYLTFNFDSPATTTAVFNALLKKKEEIEAEFGEPLVWQPQDRNNRHWIGKKFDGRGLRTREAWSRLHDDMIDAMIRLDKTLRERLRRALNREL